MNHPALIEAVRFKTAAAISALCADARAEAARCRDDADRAIEQRRIQLAARLATVATSAARAAQADATRRSRQIRNAAKAALANRLFVLAREGLGRLRDGNYPARFSALAGELPRRNWTRVSVSPADVALAQSAFPGVHIDTDTAIIGGLIADDGALRIDNTLEQRLTTEWPTLLPRVMTDVLESINGSQPAS